MTTTSTAVLHLVTFGARRCHGNEVWLHSHLGKRFSGELAMKNDTICSLVFGQCFVWVTDCHAIEFILSYDGANHTILCLQMHLMCWDVGIVLQNDHYITDVDYWLCLGANLCFAPLIKAYLVLPWSLHLDNPAPSLSPLHLKDPDARSPEKKSFFQIPHWWRAAVAVAVAAADGRWRWR
jgi:hypothetical protein